MTSAMELRSFCPLLMQPNNTILFKATCSMKALSIHLNSKLFAISSSQHRGLIIRRAKINSTIQKEVKMYRKIKTKVWTQGCKTINLLSNLHQEQEGKKIKVIISFRQKEILKIRSSIISSPIHLAKIICLSKKLLSLLTHSPISISLLQSILKALKLNNISKMHHLVKRKLFWTHLAPDQIWMWHKAQLKEELAQIAFNKIEVKVQESITIANDPTSLIKASVVQEPFRNKRLEVHLRRLKILLRNSSTKIILQTRIGMPLQAKCLNARNRIDILKTSSLFVQEEECREIKLTKVTLILSKRFRDKNQYSLWRKLTHLQLIEALSNSVMR